MHPFSLEGGRCLVASKSQSGGLWRPSQFVFHTLRQIQAVPHEELLSRHDAFGAKSRTSRYVSRSAFSEISATIYVQITYSVIPQRDRVWLPAEAYLEVHIAADLLEQEVQDGVRLSLGNSDDAARETWVDVDALPAGDWVNADDRVDRLDGFTTNVEAGSAGTLGLCHSTVQGGKAFQVGLEPRTKGRVKGIPVYMGVRQDAVHLIDH